MRWRESIYLAVASAVLLAAMWVVAGERVRALWMFGGRLVDASARESGYEIRITGTPGVPFSGSWCMLASDLTMEVRSIEGVVPVTFAAVGAVASATVQKQSAEGTIRLEIVKRGGVLKSAESTAAHGVVMVSAR